MYIEYIEYKNGTKNNSNLLWRMSKFLYTTNDVMVFYEPEKNKKQNHEEEKKTVE